ncbi:hypothetical protein QNM97_16065 [Gordonia sp. L191]|uniref:hypothetical protein n=1 Tax=Gordonia sp. L191 TaxID=2982699 RepID=UPI0024C01718|nr:hypothetical protein [Gordonia sp. L191]WHU45534.1 hypothetical protein QNM97_16065 [Gordonia sp. L191]
MVGLVQRWILEPTRPTADDEGYALFQGIPDVVDGSLLLGRRRQGAQLLELGAIRAEKEILSCSAPEGPAGILDALCDACELSAAQMASAALMKSGLDRAIAATDDVAELLSSVDDESELVPHPENRTVAAIVAVAATRVERRIEFLLVVSGHESVR